MKRPLVWLTRGQELIEFAITLPILMLLVLGIIDLGRVVYYYSAVQNAAREGARYGIVHPDDSVGTTAVVQQKAVGASPLNISFPDPWNDGNDILTVRVSYLFTPVTPLIGIVLIPLLGDPPEIWIVGSSTMYLEY